MKKSLAIMLLICVAVTMSFGLAAAEKNACPDDSKNPTGTPPNCGHAPPEPPPPPPPPGTTCSADEDGDGTQHSAMAPDNNEGGLASSIVHDVDQALPGPLGGDQGVVTEVNCALVVEVEEILGVNG
jgi:hypothetical protein